MIKNLKLSSGFVVPQVLTKREEFYTHARANGGFEPYFSLGKIISIGVVSKNTGPNYQVLLRDDIIEEEESEPFSYNLNVPLLLRDCIVTYNRWNGSFWENDFIEKIELV